jgi:hypothetical protein
MKTFNTLNAVNAAIVVLCLGACTGGGGDSGTNVFTGATSTDGSATPAASAASAAASPAASVVLSSRTVTSAVPAQVTVTVVDGSGKVLEGKLVTFSTTAGKGAFSSTTALTDAAGKAVVALYPAPAATTGADVVKASVSVNGTTLELTEGFQLTATDVLITGFTSSVTPSSSLSAYGQTDLSVSLTGAAPGAPVNVSLSSTCVSKGKATLTPATATTTNGVATFTYKDQGCGATDTADTLQASIVGATSTRGLSISLAPPSVSSVKFGSASPDVIYLKGSGLTETSLVVFEVRDLAGNPLPNQDVSLEATTFAGGLTIDGGTAPIVKKSDSSGLVTARVNSGTVPTPMRVKATLVGSGISTVSSALSIAVGLPSQLNFSFSQATINIEGGNVDGVPNTYSIIASDRLGNPVPAGTAINFVAEGSQIQASAQTSLSGGLARASVNFISAEPRPDNRRVTVLAYALGEESFLDANGNNIFDAGEAFQDLGAPYLNRAYDGIFNSATDQFFSLSGGATPAPSAACASVDVAKDPLNLLRPLLNIPSRPTTCDGAWGRAYVRRALETVLSFSTARPYFAGASGTASAGCAPVVLDRDNLGNKGSFAPLGCISISGAAKAGTVSFLVADNNTFRLNPMAAGTIVSSSATQGISMGPTSGTPVASTSEASGGSVSYSFDDTTLSGAITVEFQSPSGIKTEVSFGISR